MFAAAPVFSSAFDVVSTAVAASVVLVVCRVAAVSRDAAMVSVMAVVTRVVPAVTVTIVT